MGHRSLRTRALSAVLVLGAAVSLGSIASGAVTRVVIYACVDRDAHLTQIGTDRLDCGDDTLIQWNQQGVAGDPGAAGANGAPGADGVPGLKWRGAWTDGESYVKGDAVYLRGNAYIAVVDEVREAPGRESTEWDLLAQRGDNGKQGNTGPAGPIGPMGRPGPKGSRGDAGPQGTQGIQGQQGVAGSAGGLLGYEVITKTKTVAANATGAAAYTSATAHCSSGKVPLGGGYLIYTDQSYSLGQLDPIKIDASFNNGEYGWEVWAHAMSTVAVAWSIDSYAYCAKGP